MATPAQTHFDRLVLRLEFAGLGLKDLKFRNAQQGDPALVTYKGVEVNQSFQNLAVHNLSIYNLVYCADADDSITVSQSGGDAQKSLPAGYIASEGVGFKIDRLRVHLGGPGSVEVVLYQ